MSSTCPSPSVPPPDAPTLEPTPLPTDSCSRYSLRKRKAIALYPYTLFSWVQPDTLPVGRNKTVDLSVLADGTAIPKTSAANNHCSLRNATGILSDRPPLDRSSQNSPDFSRRKRQRTTHVRPTSDGLQVRPHIVRTHKRWRQLLQTRPWEATAWRSVNRRLIPLGYRLSGLLSSSRRRPRTGTCLRLLPKAQALPKSQRTATASTQPASGTRHSQGRAQRPGRRHINNTLLFGDSDDDDPTFSPTDLSPLPSQWDGVDSSGTPVDQQWPTDHPSTDRRHRKLPQVITKRHLAGKLPASFLRLIHNSSQSDRSSGSHFNRHPRHRQSTTTVPFANPGPALPHVGRTRMQPRDHAAALRNLAAMVDSDSDLSVITLSDTEPDPFRLSEQSGFGDRRERSPSRRTRPSVVDDIFAFVLSDPETQSLSDSTNHPTTFIQPTTSGQRRRRKQRQSKLDQQVAREWKSLLNDSDSGPGSDLDPEVSYIDPGLAMPYRPRRPPVVREFEFLDSQFRNFEAPETPGVSSIHPIRRLAKQSRLPSSKPVGSGSESDGSDQPRHPNRVSNRGLTLALSSPPLPARPTRTGSHVAAGSNKGNPASDGSLRTRMPDCIRVAHRTLRKRAARGFWQLGRSHAAGDATQLCTPLFHWQTDATDFAAPILTQWINDIRSSARQSTHVSSIAPNLDSGLGISHEPWVELPPDHEEFNLNATEPYSPSAFPSDRASSPPPPPEPSLPTPIVFPDYSHWFHHDLVTQLPPGIGFSGKGYAGQGRLLQIVELIQNWSQAPSVTSVADGAVPSALPPTEHRLIFDQSVPLWGTLPTWTANFKALLLQFNFRRFKLVHADGAAGPGLPTFPHGAIPADVQLLQPIGPAEVRQSLRDIMVFHEFTADFIDQCLPHYSLSELEQVAQNLFNDIDYLSSDFLFVLAKRQTGNLVDEVSILKAITSQRTRITDLGNSWRATSKTPSVQLAFRGLWAYVDWLVRLRSLLQSRLAPTEGGPLAPSHSLVIQCQVRIAALVWCILIWLIRLNLSPWPYNTSEPDRAFCFNQMIATWTADLWHQILTTLNSGLLPLTYPATLVPHIWKASTRWSDVIQLVQTEWLVSNISSKSTTILATEDSDRQIPVWTIVGDVIQAPLSLANEDNGLLKRAISNGPPLEATASTEHPSTT
ncbi:hypothetical protein BJ085DRAFT_36316, partial [Dimargaris cristalligena]